MKSIRHLRLVVDNTKRCDFFHHEVEEDFVCSECGTDHPEGECEPEYDDDDGKYDDYDEDDEGAL